MNAGGALQAAINGEGLRMLFQPIVWLDGGGLVGHEALARGPAGSAVEAPEALFAAARGSGQLKQLDWACRCGAFRDALDAGAPAGWRVFVNAEPQALNAACPTPLVVDWVRAHRELRIVVEVTERYLMDRPADLIRVVATLRELGWEIALDDAGANDAGVALLPVLAPDIVKLDRSLLAAHLSPDRVRTLAMIQAYVECSGAVLLAEGIETEEELQRARSFGAVWGQGFLLGRPEPLAESRKWARPGPWQTARPARAPSWEQAHDITPFELLARDDPTLLVSPQSLCERLLELGRQVEAAPHATLLLLSLGNIGSLPPELCNVITRLHDVCALVAVLTADSAMALPARVRLTRLPPGDRWNDQVSAVALGPTLSSAITATRRPDGRYETAASADPCTVASVSRLLLGRVEPRH